MLTRRSFLGRVGLLIPGILWLRGLLRTAEPSPSIEKSETGLSRSIASNSVNLCIVGVGTAGCIILSKLNTMQLGRPRYMAVGSTEEDLSRFPECTATLIKSEHVGRYGVLRNDLVHNLKLRKGSAAFIIGGLGGETASALAPLVVKSLNRKGVFTVGIFTFPFDFEGPECKNRAVLASSDLHEQCSNYLMLENQRLLTLCDKRTTVSEALV